MNDRHSSVARGFRPATITLATLALFLAAVGTAFAHDTWLLPTSLRIPVGRAISLSLTSGEAFPVDDFAINATRVMRAEARLAGRTTTLTGARPATLSLRYRWRPMQAGVATIAVELAPKTLSLSADKVDEYLDDIAASPALRARWAGQPQPRRWRESYSKHAATFVRVGNPRADSSWARPLGLGLEIIPERDPTSLRAGDTLGVRVLRSGIPLSGFMLGAHRAGGTAPTFVSTDAAGRARVVLPSAELWMLAGTDLRPSTSPNLEWESDFATVTLSVQPRTRGR